MRIRRNQMRIPRPITTIPIVSKPAAESSSMMRIDNKLLIKILITRNNPMIPATAARTLSDTLDSMPNEDSWTRVTIIAVDSSLIFFSLTVRSFPLFSHHFLLEVNICVLHSSQNRQTAPNQVCWSWETLRMYPYRSSRRLVNLRRGGCLPANGFRRFSLISTKQDPQLNLLP
ncbi:hypothetical protein KEM48_003904 [Puccinia striiformis f. sp. tritici PST-130]|nr:hypothetical protein KEM48_003904 [Puccinia striiformis f. sp. tritici PST-130]